MSFNPVDMYRAQLVLANPLPVLSGVRAVRPHSIIYVSAVILSLFEGAGVLRPVRGAVRDDGRGPHQSNKHGGCSPHMVARKVGEVERLN